MSMGYTRGAWATPIRVYTPPQPPAPTPTVAPVVTQPVIPQATFIPSYDPARIFKDIKVVADLRQSGEERGEVQSGDNGSLGPGGVAPPQMVVPSNGVAQPQNNLGLVALAIAAFVIFGG